MRIEDTALPGVRLIHLDVFADSRGSFAETYDSRAFAALGVADVFVHDSWSRSARAGVVRGLHFQVPPAAQAKLVRVARGRVFDVVVDLRRRSPTFGRHLSLVLDAAAMQTLVIPAGFAHGFCTLEDDTEITYKMSDHFSPPHYKGLLWCDPALGIDWPVAPADAIVSERDAAFPGLRQLPEVF